nr:MAG TPA: hypothetical protein [Caudoviricetes sp.]
MRLGKQRTRQWYRELTLLSICAIMVLDVRLMQCESRFLERYSYEDFLKI